LERCPLCGHASHETLEGRDDRSNGRTRNARVERCLRCDVAWVTPPPPLAALANHYNDDGYYAEWVTRQQRARRRLWRQRLRLVRAMRRSGDLLDVGCGDGAFLQAAQAAGYRCAGTELSAWAANRVRQQLGLAVTTGSLRSARRAKHAFDLITMWHVLEHLVDPRGDLDEAWRLLRPGGTLFVAVPNRRSDLFNAVYRLVKRRTPPLYTPGDKELHLFHFTPGGLRRLLEGAGFTVVAMGLDVPDADWRKRWVDRLARGWFYLTGENRTMAMLAVAVKPPGARPRAVRTIK
jgi:SAM-dependent methyltransferase